MSTDDIAKIHELLYRVNIKIHIMLNFKEIEKRIKKHTGLSESREIAALFKMTPQNYSNKKGTGTLLPVIIEWAIQENVNLNWLLRGELPGIVAEPEHPYLRVDDDPQIREMVSIMRDLDEPARSDLLKQARKEHKLKMLEQADQVKGELIDALEPSMLGELKNLDTDPAEERKTKESGTTKPEEAVR